MLVYYISHPQVKIEPDKPVPQWCLSDVGRQRLMDIADRNWVKNIVQIYSSNEVKAVETAQILASANDTEISIIPQSAEINRSATGYVPHERHEELADQCFGEPEISAHGWERAVDAQGRIYDAVSDVLRANKFADPVAFVGHGGVGTLLACKLAGTKISRDQDQPGGGHVFAFEWPEERLLFSWRALEEIQAHKF